MDKKKPAYAGFSVLRGDALRDSGLFDPRAAPAFGGDQLVGED
jgi:hypothetical protein